MLTDGGDEDDDGPGRQVEMVCLSRMHCLHLRLSNSVVGPDRPGRIEVHLVFSVQIVHQPEHGKDRDKYCNMSNGVVM